MTTTKPQSGLRLTVEEFMELDDTDDRRKMELDDGVLYIMPRPRIVHNYAQGEFFGYLRDYRRRQDGPGIEVYTDVIVALSLDRRRLYAPDVTIILPGNPCVVGERMVEGAPDIVIEVLSSDRNRDLVRKRQVYAEAGIPHYWLCDLRQDTLTLLELRDGGYLESATLTADDTLTTPLLPGFTIPLADIFRHPHRPPHAGE
ncbi:MAG: Uma2 family endonuclease [Chloroflexi bacterium]|nr:Uma2 family endonuclease [Chloroflexota bacterium]